MSAIVRYFVSKDRFGHGMSVTYKGAKTFKTKFGAFVSLTIRVLVFIKFFTKLLDLVDMTSPLITNYSRPIYKDEIEALGEIRMDEYRLNTGVFFESSATDSGYLEIPEGVGRIVSYVRVASDSRDGPETYYPTVPCSHEDLFPYVNQEVGERAQLARQFGYCLDPQHAVISGVSTFGDEQKVILTLQSCQDNPEVIDKSACLTNDQLINWSDVHAPRLKTVTSFGFLDFMDITEPFKSTIVEEVVDNADYLTSYEVRIRLQLHDVNLQDQIYSPFQSDENQFHYLTTAERVEEVTDISRFNLNNSVATDPDYQVRPISFLITYSMFKEMNIEQRTRYNFWNLLGDFGGFRNALLFIASFFMTDYSAYAFRKDLLNRTQVDKDTLDGRSQNRIVSSQMSTKFKKVSDGLKSQEPDQRDFKVVSDTVEVFSWAMRRGEILKHTLWDALRQTFCKGDKQSKFKKRLIGRVNRHLDLQRIIESQMTLALLVRRTLSRGQRTLLNHQRDRLPGVDESTGSSSSSNVGSDFALDKKMSEKRLQGFIKMLESFQPSSELDLKLLQGVIQRDRYGRKKKPMSESLQRPAESGTVAELSFISGLSNNSYQLDADTRGKSKFRAQKTRLQLSNTEETLTPEDSLKQKMNSSIASRSHSQIEDLE